MARKNPPKGRGRPRGSRNKRTLGHLKLLDKKLSDPQCVDLLVEIARGKVRKVLDGRGNVVEIQDAPNASMAQYLADRKWGRMPQPISTPPESGPITLRVIHEHSDSNSGA